MQVRIAFVTDADGNPDVSRIGTIEDHPDDDAKRLIREGIAGQATEQEIADFDTDRQRRRDAGAEDLSDLTKAELRERLPDDADVPSSATKADLVEAVQAAEQDTDNGPGPGYAPGGVDPYTTVSPGAMQGDSSGPGDTATNTTSSGT